MLYRHGMNSHETSNNTFRKSVSSNQMSDGDRVGIEFKNRIFLGSVGVGSFLAGSVGMQRLSVDPPDALAGCSFGPVGVGTLLVGFLKCLSIGDGRVHTVTGSALLAFGGTEEGVVPTGL